MRLYAQHGAQAGSRIAEGIERGVISGAIFSPRDISLERLTAQLRSISSEAPKFHLMLDPQYYTCVMAESQSVRLGSLSEDYSSYYRPRRSVDLRRESAVREDIRRVIEFQRTLPLTYLIAPNILVSRSLDSRDASISMDFVQLAMDCVKEAGEARPLLVTLAVSRDALLDRKQLEEFTNEITALDNPPHGFYLLIAGHSSEIRTEIYNSDVIAAWLYMNHVLCVNGFEVINGYSDVLTPFLCSAGGSAGATGWWSNLRAFSLERFGPSSGGGRLPIQRYLSTALLNRVTFRELDILKTLVPSILNGLPTDALYDGEGSEPFRSEEVLQSWESISHLCSLLDGKPLLDAFKACLNLLEEARKSYDEVKAVLSLDQKSNDDHLDALEYGMRSFAEIAELNLPA